MIYMHIKFKSFKFKLIKKLVIQHDIKTWFERGLEFDSLFIICIFLIYLLDINLNSICLCQRKRDCLTF